MSIHRDYVPKKDSLLYAWGGNFTVKVAENATAWTIPTSEVSALQAAYTSFAQLYEKVSGSDRTRTLVSDKNDARDAFVELVRTMVGFRLRNPIITDGQRLALGLNVRSTTPTPIDVPKTFPTMQIKVATTCRLKISFTESGTKSRAKPYGIDGAIIAYAILPEPPVNVAALSLRVRATRTPHVIAFAEEEIGKKAYFSICWQNEKGEQGPWSPIKSANIV
jgi:hypothetical protein